MKNIIVKTSKVKIIFGIVISLIFEILSIFMLFKPDKLVSFFFRSSQFILIIGLLTILFSSVALFYLLKRLIFNDVAFIVNEDGIIDNTNASSVGFVPWNDVVDIKKIRAASTDFLLIEVRDAKKYIAKSKNFFQNRIMKMNWKYYGTPITVSSNSLKCNFDELQQNVISMFDEWKKKGSISD